MEPSLTDLCLEELKGHPNEDGFVLERDESNRKPVQY